MFGPCAQFILTCLFIFDIESLLYSSISEIYERQIIQTNLTNNNDIQTQILIIYLAFTV